MGSLPLRLRSNGCLRDDRDDDVHVQAHEFGRELGQALEAPVGGAVFDDDVPPST